MTVSEGLFPPDNPGVVVTRSLASNGKTLDVFPADDMGIRNPVIVVATGGIDAVTGPPRSPVHVL